MKIIVGIIIFRSGLDLLLKNLAMFSKQAASAGNNFDLKIVLLDNDGGRQIEEIKNALKGHLPPAFIGNISYISSPNIGFGAGHNRIFADAARDGEFDYYLCANPDGIPHNNMLDEMVSFAKKNGDRGIFEARQFPVEHPKSYDLATGKTAWCSGCCLLFPRAVFEELGGFDEFFFMYMEDVDISWRTKLLGYGCYTVQDALFFHFVDEGGRDVRKYMLTSAYKLGCKYKSPAFKTFILKKLRKLLTREELSGLVREIEGKRDRHRQFEARKFMDFKAEFYFSDVRW
jgi:GT2 family glycosyltransferase